MSNPGSKKQEPAQASPLASSPLRFGRWWHLSLRARIVGLCAGLIAVILVSSLSITNRLKQELAKPNLQIIENYSQQLSQAIVAQFFERYGDVQAFAINPALQNHEDPKAITAALNQYAALYGIYDLILLVTPEGKLIAANDRSPAGKALHTGFLFQQNFSDQPWFKAALSGQWTKNQNLTGSFVGPFEVNPWVAQLYGEKRLTNTFSTAVKNSSGKTIAVLCNYAHSSWVQNPIHNVLAQMKAATPSAQAFFVDAKGTLLSEAKASWVGTQDAPSPNWDRLLKLSLWEAGHPLAQKAALKQPASLISETSQPPQVMAYHPLSGAQFTEQLGWSVLLAVNQSEVFTSMEQTESAFYRVYGALGILGLIGAWFLGTLIARRLSQITEQMAQAAKEFHGASSNIAEASKSLKTASQQQAEAIQETAASIEEVAAMTRKNAENASQSQDLSRQSKQSAENGQSSIEAMIQAIREISQSNAAIMNQVDAGNQQISQIVKVINDIGNKTKVINDIVFQTKLLSFNASVEAARAGEHGKGFAVVAEEVGKLAEMSGNAAKEISSMLESSLQQVDQIVKDTKSKVEKLVAEGRSKVDHGIQVAQQCQAALAQILGLAQQVDQRVCDIASASREQAQAVTSINTAISQLDQTAQKNTQLIETTVTGVAQIKSQAERLDHLVQQLLWVIHAKKRAAKKHRKPENMHAPQAVSRAAPEAASTETAGAAIVSLDRWRNPQPQGHEAVAEPSSDIPHKLAAGAESISPSSSATTPSRDDPRFEEI